jgi:pimeloyl-ACP methyl ester carboxylesterase
MLYLGDIMYKKLIHSILKASLSILLLQSTFSFAGAKLNDNRTISYTDDGNGTPLILIHAFPTDKELWATQRNTLKKYFRVITFDLWGFGQSAPVNGAAITMTEYADQVKQLLDQLHIQKAIIGGESMGGYITLSFLEKYPDRVQGIILSDTQSLSDNPETKQKRELIALDVIQHGTSNFINGFISKALSSKASEKTINGLKNMLMGQDKFAVASAARGMALRHDTSNVISNSTLPMLIITGDQDALISPEQSENMQHLAKNSKLVIIANAGHLSNLEQAELWDQAVIQMFYKSDS